MKEYIKDYKEAYKEFPLFCGINEEDILPMLTCLGGYIRDYKKKEFILLSDEAVKCIGVVLSGCVYMVKEDIWGNKTILAVMKELELFGETFACGNTLSATVSFLAGDELKVLYLPFDRVMHSCSRSCVFHHRLIENMVTLIANKNVQLMEKLEVVSKKTLREKISGFLSIQAQKNNSSYFTIPMGRIQLAEYLCVNRSALTRELNVMKLEGLIEFEKNTYKILKSLD
jgi:CRP-like cAMP-binding protein